LGRDRNPKKEVAVARVDEWRSRGSYFSWTPGEGDAPSVDIFHIEMGDPGDPVLLLVHGWPTSSIDWYGVAPLLSTRFRVCAFDFPGYGFSDKPSGWGYSLRRDEELLEYYLSEVIGAKAVVVVAHDRGDSVALLHALRCSEGRAAARLDHLVLSNGNIFLPMSQLTGVQRTILDKEKGPQVLATLSPAQMAEGMGMSTFTPPRGPSDPEVEALAVTFSHQNGVSVLHETIQYLVERSKDEQKWLEVISRAEFPVTLVWGVYDTVSPPRVANHVWHEYLMQRPGRNRLYYIPDANHYSQVDQPAAYAQVVLDAFDADTDQQLGFLGENRPATPLLVDVSRERLPIAVDLL
jgi:pimeloyl-ACP methyl ester carboxylesterase